MNEKTVYGNVIDAFQHVELITDNFSASRDDAVAARLNRPALVSFSFNIFEIGAVFARNIQSLDRP